ncbi:MATE efflux family protein [Wolffia australiana]
MECSAKCDSLPELAASIRFQGSARRLIRSASRRAHFRVLPCQGKSIKRRISITRRPASLIVRGLSCLGFESEYSSEKSIHCIKDNRPTPFSDSEQLEGFVLDQDDAISRSNRATSLVELQSVGKSGDFRHELFLLAGPAMLGQAVDPLAQLMETAYIGRLGALELASAGVSVSIFNIISKLFNVPLLSITTSFVAEELSKRSDRNSASDDRESLPSVTSALVLAVAIGTFEALALFWASGPFLGIMGISPSSAMHGPSQHFLRLRALGAPANVVSLAIQGVFRGFKDTQTPLFCVGLGNISAAVLFPILMYSLHWGVSGAALATVASQYIATFLLLWRLSRRTVLLPPKSVELDFSGYLKSGGLLLGRTLSVLFTMTLATSMAARQGPMAMAAHQICLQVWLAVSLLSDALALSAQAMIASSFAKFDYERVKGIASFVLKTGVLSGLGLAVVLGASFHSIARLFTTDVEVLRIAYSGLFFVSSSQPINALAFIFDGLHFGISDFSYAALSMMVIGVISCLALLYAPSIFGLRGVWLGLTLFMSLRTAAGFIRLRWRRGPWSFLQEGVPCPKAA